jgi:hypothetical protein
MNWAAPLIRHERRLTHLTDLGRLVRPMLEEVLAHAESTKTAAHRFLDVEDKPLRLDRSRMAPKTTCPTRQQAHGRSPAHMPRAVAV